MAGDVYLTTPTFFKNSSADSVLNNSVENIQ